MDGSMLYDCTFCSFRSKNGIDFVKHIFEAHSFEATFHYKCGISSCTRVFTSGSSFDAFRSHCYQKHHNWQHDFTPTLEDGPAVSSAGSDCTSIREVSERVSIADTPPDYESTQEDTNTIDYNVSNDVVMPVMAHDPEQSTSNMSFHKDIIKIAAAKFILTLKEKFKLTQTSLDYTVKGVEELLLLSSKYLEQSVSESLGLASSPLCFHLSPFDDLKTEYQQTKFFKENFGLIEPVACELGTSFKYQQTGIKRRLVEVKETFQYIPLMQNLEKLLNNQDVYQEVIQSHARSDNLIGDFCDASLYKHHPLYVNNDGSLNLQFIIYFDEVEVTNPLGSFKGRHKLVLFYYTLGNIHPKHRAILKAIQLIAVVTYPILKEYGFEAVLQPFINDMNKLRKGCLLTINDKEILVKGAVLAMLADTQAAHAIGGFKVGVGFSLRKCRNCLATKETMSAWFRENMFVLRNPVNYDYHCSLLTGVLHEADSVTYGVNYRSPLNKLDDFDVCDGQLPQDMMHILLEGVIPYTIKAMLQSFICEKHFFTIDCVNQKLSSFKFSRSESRNKPSKISTHILHDDGNIHQSASQMWNLAVYLPLMIGDLVPESDKEWECFLLLLEILQICVSSVFSVDLVEYLRVLIDMYLTSFHECYPYKNIIPKQHFMVHFPSQILKLGPLTTSWCMRMEAKNSYFKRVAQQGNFKNIALSVARRHQKLMCALLQSDDFFEKAMVKSKAEYQSSLSTEPDWIQKPIKDYLVVHGLQETTITRVDWIEWQGNKYCLDDVIWCGYEDELPKFGKLNDIIIMASQVFFALNIFVTKGTDHHHNSFLVERSSKLILEHFTQASKWVGKQHSLETHSLRSSEPGTLHIVTKYILFNLS